MIMDVPAVPVAGARERALRGQAGMIGIGAGMAGVSNNPPLSINKL